MGTPIEPQKKPPKKQVGLAGGHHAQKIASYAHKNSSGEDGDHEYSSGNDQQQKAAPYRGIAHQMKI